MVANSDYGPGGFVMLDPKMKKDRLDFWNQLYQKYEVADQDDDDAIPIELITAKIDRGPARKAVTAFKMRRGNGVRKKNKTNIHLLPCCKKLCKTGIKSKLLHEIKSGNIEVSQKDNTTLSRNRGRKENDIKSEHQQIKSKFHNQRLSLGNSSSRCLKTKLKMEASQEDLGKKLKCQVEDVDPSRKCTRDKRAKKTSGKLEPLIGNVPQSERKSVRRRVNCALPITPKIKCDAGLQTSSTGAGLQTSYTRAGLQTSSTSRKSCANSSNTSINKTFEARIKLEKQNKVKRETHNTIIPAVDVKVKSDKESHKTQSLNDSSSDTSTNGRSWLQNQTVSEINQLLETKLLIEEKLNSDLGNMVFQRFCCMNQPDCDKSLLEFWNGEVKKELHRLSKVISFNNLSLYMKSAIFNRLPKSLKNSGKS